MRSENGFLMNRDGWTRDNSDEVKGFGVCGVFGVSNRSDQRRDVAFHPIEVNGGVCDSERESVT